MEDTKPLIDIIEFLQGNAPLEGAWFGQHHPDERGLYWWRSRLTAAIAAWNRRESAPGWISVEDRLPRDFEVVLTMHADDLYPVAAYPMPSGGEGHIWRREVEGPEDVSDYPGKHDILYRWPTHWQPLPAPPGATPQGAEPQVEQPPEPFDCALIVRCAKWCGKEKCRDHDAIAHAELVKAARLALEAMKDVAWDEEGYTMNPDLAEAHDVLRAALPPEGTT